MCPLRAATSYLDEPHDESGKAAQTGTATHVAVADWHRNKDVAAAIVAMRKEIDRKLPLAALDEAVAMFLRYSQDPKNAEAEVVLVEQQIQFSIEAAPEDQTKERIEIIGTLDQVRVKDNRHTVWDLKTSKDPGMKHLDGHVYQVAAYSVGASILLKRPVHPGGLIMTRAYADGKNAHYEYALTYEHAIVMLNALRHIVACVRSGFAWPMPGEWCRWCQYSHHERCVPDLLERTDRTSLRIIR